MSETTLMVDGRQLTDAERKRLDALLTRAQKGDKKALGELRPFMDKPGMWEAVGDLGRIARDTWIEAAANSNVLVREGIQQTADRLRRDLLREGDSQLERVLVDRIVACWLQVSYADWQHGMTLKKASYSYRDGEYDQNRMDRAHRRLLQATKALATVRRLLVPALQVNIGRNQVIHQGVNEAGADR